MSSLKIGNAVTALTLGSSVFLLSACGTVSSITESISNIEMFEDWEPVDTVEPYTPHETVIYYAGDTDLSLRTPTGYYEHIVAKNYSDPLAVPAHLQQPYTDHSLDIPDLEENLLAKSFVGANMDVRPPVVPQLGNIGIDITSDEGKTVVWFQKYGELQVTSETQAWRYLQAVLQHLKYGIAERDEVNLSITTAPADFDSFGSPYNNVSADFDAVRYSQSYKIQIGSSADGHIGYMISLETSTTYDGTSNKILDERLSPRQQLNFTTGFANHLMQTMSKQVKPEVAVPDSVEVLLGRDNNKQDAFIVKAPYEATFNVLRGVFSKYGFTVDKASLSSSQFEISFEELDPEDMYGIPAFGLAEDDYIVKVGVVDNITTIIFNDEDDKPVKADRIAAMYPAFAQALMREFAIYKREGANYIANLTEEE